MFWFGGDKPPIMDVTAGELEEARTYFSLMLNRLDDDRRAILRGESVAIVAGALVPIVGHVAFGWPLWLLGLSVSADTVALWITDKIRQQRQPELVSDAFMMTVRAELMLQRMRVVLAAPIGGARGAWYDRSKMESASWESYVMPFPILGLVMTGLWAWDQAGWQPVLITLAASFCFRIPDLKKVSPGESPDIRFLPRWPEAAYRVSMILVVGFVLYQVTLVAEPGQAWISGILLISYLAICLATIGSWLSRMDSARQDMQRFLERDPRALSYRLTRPRKA